MAMDGALRRVKSMKSIMRKRSRVDLNDEDEEVLPYKSVTLSARPRGCETRY